MSQLLPHLSQLVLLDRGQAYQVHGYLKAELVALLRRNPDARPNQRTSPGEPSPSQRMSPIEALALAPAQKLLKRLAVLVERDKLPLKRNKKGKVLPPRQHRLLVPYDQMTAVRHYYPRMMASAGGYAGSAEILATALGKFHQPSLTLGRHIELPPTNRLLASFQAS